MLAMPDSSPDVLPIELVADDGFVLGATLFLPRARPRATVIIHPATAAPQSYYRRFAFFAASSGLRAITYDYRGIGRSRPRSGSLRGFAATMTDWAERDAAAIHRFVGERFTGEPVLLVGHSFGGQLLGLIDETHAVAGAVLVGAQLGYYGHWSGLARLRLAFIWRVLVPALGALFGYAPAGFGVGEDLPRGVAEQWARWCLHPDYLIGEHPEARARFARFDRSLLLFSFTDDAFAPERAVQALLERLPHAGVEHRRIDPREHGDEPIGHFGFFRGRFADSLWRESLRFFDAVLEREAERDETSFSAA